MKTKNRYRRTVPIAAGLLIVVITSLYFFINSISFIPSATTAEAKEFQKTIDPCKEYGLKAIEAHAWLPEKFKLLSMQPIADLCEIAIESDNKYITLYANKDYVMVGDLFQNKKAVTKDLVDKIEGRVLTENREALEKCVALTYTPKERNINRSLFMVVTPGCHFCEEAEEEIEFLAERYGLTIKLIIYAKDPEKVEKSVTAICQNIPINTFGTLEFKSEKNDDTAQCEKGKAILIDTIPVIDRIGINGFPTFIFDTGNKVVGGNMKNLEAQMVLTLAGIENELLTANQGAQGSE